ncbi:MAG: hypothetical protein CMJ46_11890 [Planctomyces sp.]|nr:hypothetical protein [Planctomyces sp.]
MTLITPSVWWLLLIPLVLMIEWWRRSHAFSANVSWRNAELGMTWRLQLRRLVPLFRMLGFVALIVAIASPFDWKEVASVPAEGIALEIVVDRSGSMLADDYEQNGQRITRLAAVSNVAGRFIVGDEPAEGLGSDSIGLITFAAQAEVASPLTLDHEAVVAELDRTEPAADYREDGTAIGDGWALAIAELQRLEASVRDTQPENIQRESQPLTKVVVLLTDGEQNAGRLDPEKAAALARFYGVRTYVIGLEPRSIQADVARKRIQRERDRLSELASSTGGRFYTVSDLASLEQVYDEIDTLERTPVGEQHLRTRHHWAVSPFTAFDVDWPPILMMVIVFFGAETALRWTLLREAN